MAGIPRWKGSLDIQEAPGSPRRQKTVSGVRVTRIFAGPYTALLAAEPVIGQEMEGTAGVYVESVDIVPDRAGPTGPGKMTVSLANESSGDVIESPEDTQPVYEIEWAEIEKPLQQHPRYNGDAFGGASILDEITYAGTANTPLIHILDEIFDAASSAARVAILDNVATASTNHRNLLYDIAAKMARGQRSYVVPAPIARRTSTSYSNPATTAQGTIEAPPGAVGAPAGYVWLKTADRGLRQGRQRKWERVEEWTGADEWDTDFYS